MGIAVSVETDPMWRPPNAFSTFITNKEIHEYSSIP